MKHNKENLKEIIGNLKEHGNWKELALEESNRLFEDEMKEQLIKDGYLGKDEKLETMHWQNGKIEINGKKIKPEHEKKYNEIYDKRFEGCQVFRKVPGKFE